MTRASYTVDFKLSVVEWVRSGGRSLREASKQFGVDRKCIRQWVREKAILGSARLRQGPHTRKLHGGRGPRSHDLDRRVLEFLLEQRRLGLDVGDGEVKQRAMDVARALGVEDFKASPSWLKGWKMRSGIVEQPLEGKSADVLSSVPVGSALVSHVTRGDRVLLDQRQTNEELPQSVAMPTGHVISQVITPDHTYCREPPQQTYTELLHHAHIGGHQLESDDVMLLSNTPRSVQRMCVPSSDPVMSSTQVDHFCCELDLTSSLGSDEVFGSEESKGSLPTPLPHSPSLSSLSPPKRSSLDSRPLLWPSLGCTGNSLVTFPEFQDFTDPLTGLLANRRSQPVFPARPEIFMSNSETTSTESY